jgi:hypothetical protein
MTASATQTGPAPESQPGPVATAGSRRNVIFVAVLLGMLLAALDQTIVATAGPVTSRGW